MHCKHFALLVLADNIDPHHLRLISTVKMLRRLHQILFVLPPVSTSNLLWICGLEHLSRLRLTIMKMPQNWA